MVPSLLRTGALAAGLVVAALPGRAAADTLLEILGARADTAAFLNLVSRTDLADALTGEGPFTLFVPADAAFAALPDGTLDGLTASENAARLTGLLSFHVVPGEVRRADLDHDQALSTVAGDDLAVAAASGPVRIGGAGIAEPDIAASNGLVHVIDGVLVPPGGI